MKCLRNLTGKFNLASIEKDLSTAAKMTITIWNKETKQNTLC